MNKEIKFFRDIKKITRENRRIFSEVNKVFVTCQIIFFILDIRNPMGTWPSFLTQKDKYKSKKILIILNKCDLIPFNIAENWIRVLSKHFLVFGFFCKDKNENEKKKVLRVIRQIKKQFFPRKKTILAGVIGYPNVGKSSFINSLIGKKSLSESCIPGETKLWQFLKLSKNIFLIDSPGTISGEEASGEWGILKGTIKVEKTGEISKEILDTVHKIIGDSMKKKLKNFDQRKDLLLKGGKHNHTLNNYMLIQSFLSGNFPWFSPIPKRSKSKYKFINVYKWKYSNI
jgi:nuclear GTP-binding protein